VSGRLSAAAALLAAGIVILVASGAPGWVALLGGVALSLSSGGAAPAGLAPWTGRVLQLGVVALGAGMNLSVVLRLGASGALLTAASLAVALLVGALAGRALRVPPNTSLMLSVGTAICGGSAIAAVAGVLRPKAQETSIALAVVFLLNAVGLLVFPPLGHLLGLSEVQFGRWAALAIHDTSSVVGAALAYGPTAVQVATATKLARALWIVPLTVVVALRVGGKEGAAGKIRWPWFIAGFLAAAALFTFVPAVAPARDLVAGLGRKLLVVALFLIGRSLSRQALREVGWRPLAQGVVLWLIVAAASLPLARLGD